MLSNNCFKKIKIITAPKFKNNTYPIPEWIGENCVGLTLSIKQNSNNRSFNVLSTDLSKHLKKQTPQTESIRAANWIDEYVFWKGEFSIKDWEVEIL